MSEPALAHLNSWLVEPLDREVAVAVERLRRAPDVQQVAVMPDVHLATDVCVGVVVATSHRIYPQAVGGDIGCGMLAVAFDTTASLLEDPSSAGRLLAQLGRSVPARNRGKLAPLPPDLSEVPLSHTKLNAVRRDEGVLEFGTLGSGNHFIELQADEDGRLWLMVHSGSRAMGPAIRDHHLSQAEPVGSGLRALDARSGCDHAATGVVSAVTTESSHADHGTRLRGVMARLLREGWVIPARNVAAIDGPVGAHTFAAASRVNRRRR